jgi:hypothetical protein
MNGYIFIVQVHPKTGKTEWFIIPRVNIDWFNLVLESFAKAIGTGKNKIVLLVLDRAGWHMSEKVVVPEGIYLEPLPAYSRLVATGRTAMATVR